MKRITWLIIVMFLLVGCDGNNIEVTPPDDDIGTSKFNKELLFTTWELHRVNYELTINKLRPTTITFKSNGDYSTTGEFGLYSGTFRLDEWRVICTNSFDEVFSMHVGKISTSELLFTSSDFEIGSTFELKPKK